MCTLHFNHKHKVNSDVSGKQSAIFEPALALFVGFNLILHNWRTQDLELYNPGPGTIQPNGVLDFKKGILKRKD